MNYIGAIEAGGTKFVCAIGNSDGVIFKKIRIVTETPEITMAKVIDFFKSNENKYPINAIGCGSFGPVDPNKLSDTFGFITSTPKLAWRNFNLVETLKNALNVPIGFDTDVNASALGEYYWGAAKNLNDFIYLTIGTGIGGGIMVNKTLLHGVMHAEVGHILIEHDKEKDPFKGICPYHKNCLEGLASGPAIKERWQVNSALDLPKSHKAWDLEADYLATALYNYIMCYSPQRIILGGGVMKQRHLFALIRDKLKNKLNGYLNHSMVNDLESSIVPVALGDNSGVMGALALAKMAFSETQINN